MNLDEWKYRRGKALQNYYVTAFLAGLLINVYISTELFYIKQISHDGKQLVYLTIFLGMKNISSVIAALVGSIYYDLTLKIKELTIAVICLLIVGNALYVLPYSIWYPLFGTTIIGTYSAAFTAALAEIIHIVEEKDLAKTLGICGAFKTLGMFTGPCVAYAFFKVDVTIGNWHLTYGNMPAMVSGILAIILALRLFLSLDNLAKIHDLKANAERQKDAPLVEDRDFHDNDDFEEQYEICEKANYAKDGVESKSMKVYFKNAWHTLTGRHYCIFVTASATTCFIHFLSVNLITVMSIELLNWGVLLVATTRLVTLAGGISGTVLAIYVSRRIQDFYQFYAIVVSTMLPVGAIIVIPYIRNHTARGAFLLVTCFILGVLESSVRVMSVTLVAKLVRSELQGIAEALRVVSIYLANAISGFAVSTIYAHILIGGGLLLILNICCAFVLAFKIVYFTK